MIIFHEGMPGSGKSYAAMRDYLIPALQKGRQVYARMNGLDLDKICEVSGVDRQRLDELLHEIPEDRVSEVCQVRNDEWPLPADCLLILDELQNFYPQARGNLSPETTKFISEHRHRGMDILCMGQLLSDCHRMWVNRTNRKVQFLNREAVGKPNSYKWRVYTGNPDSRGKVLFSEVSSGNEEYDPKFFGTYKSFRDDTANTDRLTDDRGNIYKSKMFRVWLPLLGGLALVSLIGLFWLFNGGLTREPQKVSVKPVKVETTIERDGQIVEKTTTAPVLADAVPKKPDPSPIAADDWPDPVTDLVKENRPRIGLAMRTVTKTRINVEFRDKANQIVESLNSDQLKAMGWAILISDDLQLVSLAKNGKRLTVTAWPLPEPIARVSEPMQDQIRRDSARDAARYGGPPPAQLAQADPEISFRHIGGDRSDPYTPTR